MKDNYDFSEGKRGAVIPIASGQIKLNIVLKKILLIGFERKFIKKAGGIMMK